MSAAKIISASGPARGDLPSQRGLALRVAGDGLVLADRGDEPSDPRAEPPPELGLVGTRLLDRVVQHAGRNHVVARAGVVEQQADLERMDDERVPGKAPDLARVTPLPVLDRRPSPWEPPYQIGQTLSTPHPVEAYLRLPKLRINRAPVRWAELLTPRAQRRAEPLTRGSLEQRRPRGSSGR